MAQTDSCPHDKAQITTDSGETVCPICDEIEVQTLDEDDDS